MKFYRRVVGDARSAWHIYEGRRLPNLWHPDNVMRCGRVLRRTAAIWQQVEEPTDQRCRSCWVTA